MQKKNGFSTWTDEGRLGFDPSFDIFQRRKNKI